MQPHNKNEIGVFPGTVKSGLARIRKELKKLGYTLGKVEGRYHPYGEPQRVTPGINAHRVGCSRSIAVSYTMSHSVHESDAQREERKAITHKAWAQLRAAGLPLDDKGWMDCEFYNI